MKYLDMHDPVNRLRGGLITMRGSWERPLESVFGLVKSCYACRRFKDDEGEYVVRLVAKKVSHGLCLSCYAKERNRMKLYLKERS